LNAPKGGEYDPCERLGIVPGGIARFQGVVLAGRVDIETGGLFLTVGRNRDTQSPATEDEASERQVSIVNVSHSTKIFLIVLSPFNYPADG